MEKGKFESQTKKERSDRHHDEWFDGRRVITVFIDLKNNVRWHEYLTGAGVSCIQKGTILYSDQNKRYYRIKEVIYSIDLGELYVYIDEYLKDEVEKMKREYELSTGPEWFDNQEK